MSKLHSLARIVLIAAAIEVCLTLWGILYALIFAAEMDTFSDITPLILISGLIYFSGLVAAIYLLITKCDVLVLKIVKQLPSEETIHQIDWIWLAFRLMVIYFAITYIPKAVHSLFSAIQQIVLIHSYDPQPTVGKSMIEIIRSIVSIATCIYLLCGAPHFVRWQVRKTIEQCKKLQDFDSASD